MIMYFIAVVAPGEINEKVLKWKNYMKEHFGCLAALRSPAHITLVPPTWMNPELEPSLINSIDEFSKEAEPFPVRIRNFDAFPPRVIFADIVKNTALLTLQKNIVDFLIREDKYPVVKDTRPFHPHITIATRDLYKKAFYEAWEVFKKKTYEAGWIADGISLLRHNKKNWDVIFTSRFIK